MKWFVEDVVYTPCLGKNDSKAQSVSKGEQCKANLLDVHNVCNAYRAPTVT